jgi:hypothetical protein
MFAAVPVRFERMLADRGQCLWSQCWVEFQPKREEVTEGCSKLYTAMRSFVTCPWMIVSRRMRHGSTMHEWMCIAWAFVYDGCLPIWGQVFESHSSDTTTVARLDVIVCYPQPSPTVVWLVVIVTPERLPQTVTYCGVARCNCYPWAVAIDSDSVTGGGTFLADPLMAGCILLQE